MIDGEEIFDGPGLVFVGNISRYAMGLQILHYADFGDGLLDVCTFKEGSFWNGIRYLSGVLLGQHQSWEDCITLRTTQLRIEADEDVPYQLDGDPGGCLPIDIRVLPGDRVLVELSPYDLNRGRIVYRFK